MKLNFTMKKWMCIHLALLFTIYIKQIVDVSKCKQAQIPKSINPLLANLINLCWSFEAKDRPSFKYLNKYLKFN